MAVADVIVEGVGLAAGSITNVILQGFEGGGSPPPPPDPLPPAEPTGWLIRDRRRGRR